MTKTSSFLLSYHPTPCRPPITIGHGPPCLVQGHGFSHITPSLSFHQVLYVPNFLEPSLH